MGPKIRTFIILFEFSISKTINRRSLDEDFTTASIPIFNIYVIIIIFIKNIWFFFITNSKYTTSISLSYKLDVLKPKLSKSWCFNLLWLMWMIWNNIRRIVTNFFSTIKEKRPNTWWFKHVFIEQLFLGFRRIFINPIN